MTSRLEAPSIAPSSGSPSLPVAAAAPSIPCPECPDWDRDAHDFCPLCEGEGVVFEECGACGERHAPATGSECVCLAWDGRACGDEGRLCDACQEKEAAYWARYFGQDYGTKEEKAARLAAMRPLMPREADRNAALAEDAHDRDMEQFAADAFGGKR